MNNTGSKPTTIDEYIAGFPPGTQVVLEEIRALIHELAPEATEKISYGIPTFHLNGNLVHFAGYARHIGFYPGRAGIDAFRSELGEYKVSAGTIQFPLGKPLPMELIARIVEMRTEEQRAKR